MNVRAMVRTIGGARNLMWWKAWYGLEPRGEERQDLHAALLALFSGNTKEGTTIVDLVQLQKDLWHPVSREEKKRRKAEKRRASQRKMKAQVKGMMSGEQNGRQSRKVDR